MFGLFKKKATPLVIAAPQVADTTLQDRAIAAMGRRITELNAITNLHESKIAYLSGKLVAESKGATAASGDFMTASDFIKNSVGVAHTDIGVKGLARRASIICRKNKIHPKTVSTDVLAPSRVSFAYPTWALQKAHSDHVQNAH